MRFIKILRLKYAYEWVHISTLTCYEQALGPFSFRPQHAYGVVVSSIHTNLPKKAVPVSARTGTDKQRCLSDRVSPVAVVRSKGET